MSRTQRAGGRPETRVLEESCRLHRGQADKSSLDLAVVVCQVNLPCFQIIICQLPKHALGSYVLSWSDTLPGQT